MRHKVKIGEGNLMRTAKIVLILILAGILRVSGIYWGLTDDVYFHATPHYQDEAILFQGLRSMDLKSFNINPKHMMVYAKGPFPTYALGAWLKILSVFKFVNITKSFDYYKTHPLELRNLYVACRLMTVFFGIGAVLLTYFVGKSLYTEKIGLLAAFLLSILPVHVVFSHYIATDVMLSFFALLIILLCYFIIIRGDLKWYILCGLTIGVTIATKYPAGIILLVFLLAHYYKFSLKINKNILLGLFFIFVGFFIGAPCNFFYYKEFIHNFVEYGILGQYPDLSTVLSESFEPNSGIVYQLTTAMRYGMGTPMQILSFAGIIYAFVRRTKHDLLILLWIVTFNVLISGPTWRVVRWFIPLTPFYVLLISRFYYEVKNKNKLLNYFLLIVILITGIYTSAYSIAYVKGMAEKGVRTEASEWIDANIKEGSSIGVIRDPWFTGPEVVIMEYYYKEDDPCYVKRKKKYKIIDYKFPIEDYVDIERLRKNPADYISVSDYEFFPYLRLKNKYPLTKFIPVFTELFEGKNYIKVKEFTKKPELFGFIPIGGFYPHDWRLPFETIIILKNVKKK